MEQKDVGLQADVLDELDWEPSVNAAEIGVTVDDGIVTLAGHVPTYAEKRAAERIAMRVEGVRGVANEIDVKLPAAFEKTDADLAKAALNAIQWNVYLPQEKVKVKVEDGWITLEGKVEWNFQRTKAEQAVRALTGVRGVTNHLEVEPRTSPQGIKEKIRRSLERIAVEDAEKIRVTADGSTVTLTGTVRSWMEREEAETAAWAAPGVKEVMNKIEVRRPAFV